MRRIGELLVAEGSLTEAAVARALHYQRMSGSGARIGTILLNWDLLSEETLVAHLARLHHCEPVLWPVLAAAPEAVAKMLKPAVALRLGAFPYALERGAIRVAFLNPSNLAAVDETAALLHKRVIPAVTSEVRLLQAHHKFYGRGLMQETRSLIHKLQRRPEGGGPSARLRTAGEVVDFRAPDLVRLQGERVGAGEPSPKAAAQDTGARADTASRRQTSGGLPPPPDFYAPEPAPEFPIPSAMPPPAPAEEAAAPREESLSEWVGEALGSFQKEAQRGATPREGTEATRISVEHGPQEPTGDALDDTLPGALIPAPPPAAEAANGSPGGGLWRISRMDDEDDAIVTGMWTGPDTLPPAVPYPEGGTREELAAAVLEAHLSGFPRSVVLGWEQRGTVAWYARGENVTGHAQDIWVPSHERSIFGHVERTGAPHFGPLERELWPRAMADLIGSIPPDCAVFPVRVGDSVAAFLYTDRLGEPLLYEDFGVMTRAAAALAASLSRFRLNSNSSAPVH